MTEHSSWPSASMRAAGAPSWVNTCFIRFGAAMTITHRYAGGVGAERASGDRTRHRQAGVSRCSIPISCTTALLQKTVRGNLTTKVRSALSAERPTVRFGGRKSNPRPHDDESE